MKVQTFIIHACSALAIGQLVLARHSSLSEWTLYKKQHGKVYEEPEEDARRFSLFLAAKDRIANHNRNASSSYKLGLNHLSDWTQEELNKLTGLGNGRENIQQSAEADEFLRQLMSDNEQPVPKEVDWRKVPNRVSSVKDQLQCSSSWAFAAIGVLEGQQVVRNFTRELIDLSAQDLVDCSSTNQNCVFGRAHFAFADISRMQGVNSESDYPYEGSFNSDRGCRFKKDQVVMSDRGSLYFYNDEAIIQKLVAQFGPVAVSVRAEPWIFYKTGIFDDATECVYKDTDHQALVVGYGTDPKLGDYWIIKNSWSKNWGEQGYIRLRRGKGMCGIGKESAIPKFDKTE